MPEKTTPSAPEPEGLRERKRLETRQRIAETALRLFLAKGFEGTTLDAIAAETGIARRTFFSYFKSKDDIATFWLNASWESMYADILKMSPDMLPIDAVRDVMVRHTARYSSEEMTSLDRLLRSSETLVARKQAFYLQQEQALFLTLCQVWRQPERRPALRMVAMASIGAMRLATQAWQEQTGQPRPAAKFLREAFQNLKAEL